MNAADERAYYDLHENSPTDQGYRTFLSRLARPLLDRLTTGMKGLDYGCGPGPALSIMMRESGMIMEDYDPIYNNQTPIDEQIFDFVTCTEVVEHFREPSSDWLKLTNRVKPGGWLGIMTKLVISRERFATWHYKEDPTHVAFYSPATFQWLGKYFDMDVKQVDRDVILMRKHG
jgi:2-polyprenyl-3-methyl-5-hydroxy-6-metoxy-1,4-benzoquinol methylase